MSADLESIAADAYSVLFGARHGDLKRFSSETVMRDYLLPILERYADAKVAEAARAQVAEYQTRLDSDRELSSLDVTLLKVRQDTLLQLADKFEAGE